MKITVETSTKAKVEEFFEFLKKRAQSTEHKANVDTIADFIDKVMVVELKRLQNEPETFEESFDVPDDVLLEPLRRVKKQFDDAFDGFLKDKGSLTADPVGYEPHESVIKEKESKPLPKAPAADIIPVVDATETPIPEPAEAKTGNKNGHKSLKVRNLENNERDTIRSEFIALNGCLASHLSVGPVDKECTRIMDSLNKKGNPKPLSVFQVTGFVSVLHEYVAENKLILPDLPKYLTWMTTKYPAMAARYNSPAMQAKRAGQVTKPPQHGLTTTVTPNLAQGFPKRRA